MYLIKFILLILFLTSVRCDSGLTEGAGSVSESKLENIPGFGLTYYNFRNTKGIVLCFHGTGGSAQGWTSGDKLLFLNYLLSQGYGFVCPTSLDRTNKQWSNVNSSSNPDVQNIDFLIFHLGLPSNIKLFLVGHSNGGGFASRFSVFSIRNAYVEAVQYSNSSGLNAILTDVSYVFPTIFSYADCDPIVAATDVRNNQMALTSKVPPVSIFDNDIDNIYASGSYSDCHEFANTAVTTANFFNSY